MNTNWKSMFRSLGLDHLRQDDDGVDRLSRLYSAAALVALALTVGAMQFVGRPIICWCPREFTDTHRDYADAICWVSKTYSLPTDIVVPGEKFGVEATPASTVGYFRWVPLILVVQGLLVYLPHLLWHSFGRLNVKTVMDVAKVCSEATDLKTREKNLELIVHLMHCYLLPREEYLTGCLAPLAKPLAMVRRILGGNCLNFRYLVVKLLYLANAIGQVFFIGSFLSSDYHMYGLHVVERLVRGQDWGYAERFPLVTLCEFEIRHQSRLHLFVLQCTLTINLFNEKLFVFLWFWFVFVAFITAVNFLRWLFRSLYWPGHVQYVRKQIRVMDATPREAGTLAKFAENYLRRDGMFIVRLIGMNMGEVVAGEVLCGLWNRYSENGEGASHVHEMKQKTTKHGRNNEEENEEEKRC